MYFLGRFSIKDVVPSKEGESSKIKVKVRLDIHGVLNVVNASLVEKLAVAPEPEEESMEVEGQDEKAKETTADTASEVEVLDVLKLHMLTTFIAVLETLCTVYCLLYCLLPCVLFIAFFRDVSKYFYLRIPKEQRKLATHKEQRLLRNPWIRLQR